jgi:hypothetical protein
MVNEKQFLRASFGHHLDAQLLLQRFLEGGRVGIGLDIGSEPIATICLAPLKGIIDSPFDSGLVYHGAVHFSTPVVIAANRVIATSRPPSFMRAGALAFMPKGPPQANGNPSASTSIGP